MVILMEYKILDISIYKKYRMFKSNRFQLFYSIEEDRFYYKDNSKTQPTKRDLIMSLDIFLKIINRSKLFGYKVNVSLNNIKDFSDTALSLDLKRIIYGTDGKKDHDTLLSMINNISELCSNNTKRKHIYDSPEENKTSQNDINKFNTLFIDDND